jgi:hypothetical protein
MAPRTEWNEAYYGQPIGARQIVVQMQAANPGADPLRQVLTRYGSDAAPVQAAAAPPSPGQQPMRLAPPPGSGAIQQQTLAPPPKS